MMWRMSPRSPRRLLARLPAAIGAAVLAAACGGAARPAPTVVTLPKVEQTEVAASEAVDPVEVVNAGSKPRQVLRYAFSEQGELTLHSELVVFQPMLRYETRYAPVEHERDGGSFVIPATMSIQSSGSVLALLLPGVPGIGALPSCNSRIRMDARGFFEEDPPDEICSKLDASLFGLRATPLRPGIPLPQGPIGAGARWRTAKTPGNPAATYTLLEQSGSVLTVWGELEPAPANAGNPIQAVPREAWLLARVELGRPMSAATLAWVQAGRVTTRAEKERSSSVEASPPRTVLTRFNTVAGESASAFRDERRTLLERTIKSADPALRMAAIRASGISNDWRLVAPLLDLPGGDAAIGAAVGDALTSLTGRAARGVEDYVEGSAPYACRGENARAEVVLEHGIALAGNSPALEARLLALRAELWRKAGQNAAADRDFNEALTKAPAEPDVVRAAAWWLATAPDAKLRSGRKALELAQGLPQTQNVLLLVEQTRAAAQAELGNFAEAARIQKSSSSAIGGRAKMGAGADERATAAAARLEAYLRQKPWREALTVHEWPPCYRYLGLSNTLL